MAAVVMAVTPDRLAKAVRLVRAQALELAEPQAKAARAGLQGLGATLELEEVPGPQELAAREELQEPEEALEPAELQAKAVREELLVKGVREELRELVVAPELEEPPELAAREEHPAVVQPTLTFRSLALSPASPE